MRDRPPGRVEDYTGTCLVLFFVNLFWILVTVMVAFGWPVVLFLVGALHVVTRWLEQRRRDVAPAGWAKAPTLRD